MIRNDKVCAIILIDSDANIKILCKDASANYDKLENYLSTYFVDYIDDNVSNQLRHNGLIIKGVTRYDSKL